MNLQDRINGMRLSAAALYDRCVAESKPVAEITEVLKGMQERMIGVLAGHTKDLRACLLALNHFTETAESYRREIVFLQEKIADEEKYAQYIRDLLIRRMQFEKKTELSEQGVMVTLVMKNGRPSLKLR